MDKLKQYAPYIIGAIILLYILRRMSSGGGVALAPQTQFTETAQPDPFAAMRSAAFESLVGLGIVETQAGVESERNRLSQAAAYRAQDVELAQTNVLAQAAARSANLGFLQREQDRQQQQSAIDRYYSSRRTSDIIGSIGQTLGTIFGGRGGGVFTPPTFPRFGGIL